MGYGLDRARARLNSVKHVAKGGTHKFVMDDACETLRVFFSGVGVVTCLVLFVLYIFKIYIIKALQIGPLHLSVELSTRNERDIYAIYPCVSAPYAFSTF